MKQIKTQVRGLRRRLGTVQECLDAADIALARLRGVVAEADQVLAEIEGTLDERPADGTDS